MVRVRLYPAFDLVGAPVVIAMCGAAAAVEGVLPLRNRVSKRSHRWPRNVAFAALAAIVVRGAIVPATQACARKASRHRFGLLRWVPLPRGLRSAVGLLALDYTMYLWHRALHAAPLWRFHAVHHADRDLDVTTALRFHAVELVASLPFRCVQAAALGVEPSVALTYEIVMQVAALFHHSNVRLPAKLDRALSCIVVTPRMHGVHHSVDERERASNWSVLFSFWDRLHGTFRARDVQPTIGLAAADVPVSPEAVGPGSCLDACRQGQGALAQPTSNPCACVAATATS